MIFFPLVVALYYVYFFGAGTTSQILTDAGFIYPPVRSAASILRATFEILEIQVFRKKLPGILAVRPSETKTTMNAKNPSVSAPRWMSTFRGFWCPNSGNVLMM